MHDLDRTLRTYDSEADMEFEPEYDALEYEPEYDQEYDQEYGGISQEEENELAEELLTLSSEAELDHFLGKFMKKFGGVAKGLAPLAKVLKPLAKKLLPIAGTAAGAFFGGPVGAKIGGQLGSFATKLFEIEGELDSLPPYEQQRVVARRFVRLASAAAQEVADASDAAAQNSEPTSEPVDEPASEPVGDAEPSGSGDANDVARTALANAAAVHAPPLARAMQRMPAARKRSSGRWYRRGNVIVVRGA